MLVERCKTVLVSANLFDVDQRLKVVEHLIFISDVHLSVGTQHDNCLLPTFYILDSLNFERYLDSPKLLLIFRAKLSGDVYFLNVVVWDDKHGARASTHDFLDSLSTLDLFEDIDAGKAIYDWSARDHQLAIGVQSWHHEELCSVLLAKKNGVLVACADLVHQKIILKSNFHNLAQDWVFVHGQTNLAEAVGSQSIDMRFWIFIFLHGQNYRMIGGASDVLDGETNVSHFSRD